MVQLYVISCKYQSNKYIPASAKDPLSQLNLKHKAMLTSSGLIWAENSQQWSEDWFILSLFLMCIYVSVGQILLHDCK